LGIYVRNRNKNRNENEESLVNANAATNDNANAAANADTADSYGSLKYNDKGSDYINSYSTEYQAPTTYGSSSGSGYGY